MKILVVGAGIAGLSTAWALARRGHAVEVFEQGPIPNPLGASYDEHRIIRYAYGGDLTGYAMLMPDAYALWRRLWQALGVEHHRETGLAFVVRRPDPWLPPALAALDVLGVKHRELSRAEIAHRLPMLERSTIETVIESEGAGLLYPDRILPALAAHLAALGVVLHEQTQVTEIDPARAGLTAGGRAHAGDHLVVASGAWFARLLPAQARLAVPSRQVLAYLRPPETLESAWANAPALLDRAQEGWLYAVPPRDGTRLKLGDHAFSNEGDPDEPRTPSPDATARLLAGLAEIFEGFDRYELLQTRTCFYTTTPDERFILRGLGGGTWLLSACAGHGFKLAPLMGEGLAASICGERDVQEVEAWAAGLAATPRAATPLAKPPAKAQAVA